MTKEFHDSTYALQLLLEFDLYLQQECDLVDNSCQAYRRDIKSFVVWLTIANIDLLKVDSGHINQYIYARMAKGYKPSSNARLLVSLKAFYRYLLVKEVILHDPCFAIAQPKVRLKTGGVLSVQEVECLMASPDVTSSIGLRDKAMLELLYSTGVSVSELISLRIGLLSLDKAVLKVQASHSQTRDVYLTSQCCYWLNLYLKNKRIIQPITNDNDWIFLSGRGLRMTRQTFWYRIKACVAKSKLSVNISPQTLRRSFAAHLLQSGVETAVVQQVLGHKQAASVARYA